MRKPFLALALAALLTLATSCVPPAVQAPAPQVNPTAHGAAPQAQPAEGATAATADSQATAATGEAGAAVTNTAGDFKLVLLHTNDTWGYLVPCG